MPHLAAAENGRRIERLFVGGNPLGAAGAVPLDLDAEPGHLERLAALTEGRPAPAARTARELGERLQRQAHESDPDVLLEVVRRLGVHGGYGEGLLAAAVTGAIGARTGWAPPWRERLRALRRHPMADVRDAALDQVTAYE